MSISLFSKNNERLMRGLNYDSFTSLAISANDRFRKGGPISDRTIRLTKDGKGIATTTFSGTTGARVGQIADARKVFLDAVERQFGLNARDKAAGMLKGDGVDKPLTARVIKAIDEEINPYTRSERADRFVASQRGVFERAIQDAVRALAALHPNEPINVDPLQIEAEVIKLLKSRRIPMTAEGLASAVARVIADSVSSSRNADEATAAQLSQAAANGVSKSAETAPMPKIRNQQEFVDFFKTLSVTAQYGSVREDGEAPDVNGTMRKTFVFNGIVFRSDGRRPTDPTMKTGFTSQKDLTVSKNRIEAMGFGTNEDGKVGAFGATGKSGVSCGRTVNGAIGYLNPGRTFYVIDTTKLPKVEKAWDMKSNMYENGFKEHRTMKVEIEDEDAFGEYADEPIDETAGEVNVSYIPRNAIIGWVTVSTMHMDGNNDNNSRLDTLQRRISMDKDYTIQFNPEYVA